MCESFLIFCGKQNITTGEEKGEKGRKEEEITYLELHSCVRRLPFTRMFYNKRLEVKYTESISPINVQIIIKKIAHKCSVLK